MDLSVLVRILIIKIHKINNAKNVELSVKDAPKKTIVFNVYKVFFYNKVNAQLVYKIVKNAKMQQHANYVNKDSHIKKRIKNSLVLKQV